MTVTVNESIQRTTFHIKAVHDANAEIISRIQSGDHGAFRELCEANSGLVAHVALHYLPIIERRNDIEIDDLMQAGYLGMYMAAGKYTPGRGAKFSTFAVYYIRREIQRELGFYRKRRDAADIAISLYAPLYVDGATPLDIIAAGDEADRLETEDLQKAVRAAVVRLASGSVRSALLSYYWIESKRSLIADSHGVTASVISDRLHRGYALLRRDRTLQKVASDYGYRV